MPEGYDKPSRYTPGSLKVLCPSNRLDFFFRLRLSLFIFNSAPKPPILLETERVNMRPLTPKLSPNFKIARRGLLSSFVRSFSDKGGFIDLGLLYLLSSDLASG